MNCAIGIKELRIESTYKIISSTGKDLFLQFYRPGVLNFKEFMNLFPCLSKLFYICSPVLTNKNIIINRITNKNKHDKSRNCSRYC
jgi:hypothetical protein